MVQLELNWQLVSETVSKLYIYLPISDGNQKILSVRLSKKPYMSVRRKYFSFAKFLTKGNFEVSAEVKANVVGIDKYRERNDSRFLKNESLLLMNRTKKFAGNLTSAREVYEWIVKNVGRPRSLDGYLTDLSYEKDDAEDLQRAIEKKEAMCGGKSLLFVSMCRNLGIPARTVTGYFMRDGWTWLKNAGFHDRWLDLHVWAEFYENGWWTPVDCNVAQQTNEDYFGKFPTKTFGNKDLRIVVSKGSHFVIDKNFRCSLQTAHFTKGKNLKISLKVK